MAFILQRVCQANIFDPFRVASGEDYARLSGGNYADLFQGVVSGGYSILTLVLRIGIWSVLMGIIFLGYRFMLNSGHIKLREENKSLVTKFVIVSLILFNVTGIVGIVLSAGLDMS